MGQLRRKNWGAHDRAKIRPWLLHVCAFIFAVALLATKLSAAPGALQFDGSNDYVSFGAAPGLSLSNVTLEVWFKRTGTGLTASTGGGGIADAIPLIAKGRGEGDGANVDMNYILAIRSADNRLAADFEEGAAGASPGLNHPVFGTTVIANNVWYHAAATYDGIEWRLYLNGTLEATLTVNRPLRYDSIQHASLAAALTSTGVAAGAFGGILDEARIWNHARTAQQIADNYLREITSAPGLVGRWSLDDGSGTTALNTGSSGHNGTLLNGPLWVAGYNFNTPPTVTLTQPASGSTFTAPANVTLEATATDAETTVGSVSFYQGTTLLGTVNAAPFEFTWNTPALGHYSLTAVATDSGGLSATSAPVAVAIHNAVIQIASPTNTARYFVPAEIPITTTVNESSVTVTLVEFFANSVKIGEATTAPWSLNWSQPAAGNYSLTAIATDSTSGTHTSAAVAVTVAVNTAPAVAITAPANNASVTTPGLVTLTASASDADGTVTNVAFFTNGVFYLQTSAPPFSVVWTNPPLGVHTITASAFDDRGATNLSESISISAANARVQRGPYLQNANPNAITVAWRTDVATDGRVRFGTDPAALTGFADEALVTTNHFVRLTGLLPDTRYYYSIGSTAVPLLAGTNYFFTTPPLAGSTKPSRVWVLGDAGTKNASQRAVRDAFYNFTTNTPAADLILMLGDNAYDNGTDAEYQAAVFDMYTNALRSTTLWSTIGNHDTASSANPAPDIPYFKMFNFPTAGEAGGVASGTEKYYSFDYANVHFVCLDSMSSSRAANSPMAVWLQSDLTATTARWIVAFWHHPAYSKGSHNSDTETELIQMRQNLLPILDAHGVDLILVGHSHNYERSIPVDGHYGLSPTLTDTMKVDAGNGRTNGNGAYFKSDTLANARGIVHCTAGHSGAAGGGALNHPVMFMSVNVLGSVILDVAGDRLDFKMLNSSGVVQDHFTMLKGTGTEPPAAPESFTATLINSNSIRLGWAATPTNELGFQIERSTDGLNFSALLGLGANFTNYTNASLQLATTYSYRLRATNDAGASAWTAVASATTPAPPSITQQPQSLSVIQGSSATFTVTATGTAPLAYQWRRAGTDLPGETGSTFTIASAQPTHADVYSVRVTNLYGAVVSANATLAVTANQPPAAVPYSVQRAPGTNVKFPAAALLAPDPNGDVVTLQSVGPASTQGGTVVTLGSWVIYQPPGSEPATDSFPFVLADVHNATAASVVNVTVASSAAATPNVVLEELGDGSVRLRFNGIPGRAYSIQVSNTLETPVWQTLAAGTADGLGVFEFTDMNPGGAGRFYRSTQP